MVNYLGMPAVDNQLVSRVNALIEHLKASGDKRMEPIGNIIREQRDIAKAQGIEKLSPREIMTSKAIMEYVRKTPEYSTLYFAFFGPSTNYN